MGSNIEKVVEFYQLKKENDHLEEILMSIVSKINRFSINNEFLSLVDKWGDYRSIDKNAIPRLIDDFLSEVDKTTNNSNANEWF